jgi:LysR family transcriptional regulator, pca operon transcriptional activator
MTVSGRLPVRVDQRIKIRHLLCFLETARLGSVVAAADSLAITQPAVSKTLRELEETLDVQLFDRSKKNLELTLFGEVFQRYAGASIVALRQGLDSIAQARSRGEVAIRIGALPTVAAEIMPEAVRRFKAGGAETTVSILTGPNTLLLGRLRVGELDLVVGRLADADQMTGLAFEHLYSEPVAFVVRPDHPLLKRTPFDVAQIAEFPVLFPTDESIIRPTVERFLIASGVGPLEDRIETVSPTFGRSYVRISDAVWIISRGVVNAELNEGMLRELPIDTSETLGPLGLTTRADTPASPVLHILMGAVRDAARKIRG